MHQSSGAKVFAGADAAARPIFGTLNADVGDDGRNASFAALHGLYGLTMNLTSDRPLVIAIEDLHWCDRPSRRFVAYLSHTGSRVCPCSSARACGPPSRARGSPCWARSPATP